MVARPRRPPCQAVMMLLSLPGQHQVLCRCPILAAHPARYDHPRRRCRPSQRHCPGTVSCGRLARGRDVQPYPQRDHRARGRRRVRSHDPRRTRQPMADVHGLADAYCRRCVHSRVGQYCVGSPRGERLAAALGPRDAGGACESIEAPRSCFVTCSSGSLCQTSESIATSIASSRTLKCIPSESYA